MPSQMPKKPKVLNAYIETLEQIWSVLNASEHLNTIALFGLMFISMILETLSVGAVIPAMGVLLQRDIVHGYPAIAPWLRILGNPSRELLITFGMLLLVGIYLVKTVFLAFLAWRQTHFSFRVQTRLSQQLFATYLRQPYTFHLQRNSANLIRNVTGEVSMFAGSAIQPAMILMTESLVLIGLFILLMCVEPLGAVIVMLVLAVAGYGFYWVTRNSIARWGVARQHHDVLLHQHLQQGLGGAKDVKLMGREAEFLRQYELHNAMSARMGMLQGTLTQLPRLWLELLAVAGLAILVICMLMQGHPIDAILPTLGLFAAAAFRLMPSVNRLLGAMQSLRFGLPVIATLHRELGLPASPPVTTGMVAPLTQRIELSNVVFTYPGASSTALDRVSLTVQRGESVGFIGSSGAGKSTLVDILLGLLPPDEGEVLLDGNDIEANLRNWQNQIGYVPQSIYLTDDSLRRNVAFGLSENEIDDIAVKRAITAAQLDSFVDALPDGLQTIVGERGVRLSGGQRQRIGIARALYHDPSVLVLDEATSALDDETESGVMQAVNSLHGSKTLFIVAHRLSTVQHCDRLYRLDGGHIVEEGIPETVLSDAVSRKSGPDPQNTFIDLITVITQPQTPDA